MKVYDELVERFLESGSRFARVDVHGVLPKSVGVALRRRAAKDHRFSVYQLDGEIYIENHDVKEKQQ